MHNNLSVYSLNSRAGKIWERMGFTMDCEGNGVLERFCREVWNFKVWADFGRRLIGKGAEYTYRKLGH